MASETAVLKFPWNNSPIIKKAYSLNNYKIIKTNAKNKNAIIFFAGNGIYYPNEENIFKEIIIDNDRFEWENIAQDYNLRNTYSLIILVRDIYKTWYLEGINEELNTQDKVIEKLKEITKGYSVTTAGNSAGGYMAVLVGIKLEAKRIFTFSGQFFIDTKWCIEPLVEKYKNTKNKYYSLIPLLEESKSKIYYFYPIKYEWDIEQYKSIKKHNVYAFGFDEKEHGASMEYSCYKCILSQSDKTIQSLYSKYKNTIINPKEFTKVLHKFCSIKYHIIRFLQYLFFIENYHGLKVIKILGMKIKIKKRQKNNG